MCVCALKVAAGEKKQCFSGSNVASTCIAKMRPKCCAVCCAYAMLCCNQCFGTRILRTAELASPFQSISARPLPCRPHTHRHGGGVCRTLATVGSSSHTLAESALRFVDDDTLPFSCYSRIPGFHSRLWTRPESKVNEWPLLNLLGSGLLEDNSSVLGRVVRSIGPTTSKRQLSLSLTSLSKSLLRFRGLEGDGITGDAQGNFRAMRLL